MKLHAESASGNIIRSFSPGELRLDERVIRTHAIVSPDQVLTDWNPPPVEELSIADFAPALELNPEIVLFGTGARQTFPANAVMIAIMRRGVAFEVMTTAAACRTYNVLLGEMRHVVAALLIE